MEDFRLVALKWLQKEDGAVDIWLFVFDNHIDNNIFDICW